MNDHDTSTPAEGSNAAHSLLDYAPPEPERESAGFAELSAQLDVLGGLIDQRVAETDRLRKQNEHLRKALLQYQQASLGQRSIERLEADNERLWAVLEAAEAVLRAGNHTQRDPEAAPCPACEAWPRLGAAEAAIQQAEAER